MIQAIEKQGVFPLVIFKFSTHNSVDLAISSQSTIETIASIVDLIKVLINMLNY